MDLSDLFTLVGAALFFYVGIGKLARLVNPRRGPGAQPPVSHPSELPDSQLRFKAYLAQALLAAFFLLFGIYFVAYLLPLPISLLSNAALLMPLAVVCGVAGFVLGRGTDQPSARPDRKPEIEYTDITGDPEAQSLAQSPENRAMLMRLGFRSVCVIKAAATSANVSEVYEVLADPNVTAFAEPEAFFGYDAIAFRTRLSDGTMVETTLLNAMRVRGAVLGWLDERLVRLRWPRKNRPRARYLAELNFHSTAKDVWNRHRARVAALARRAGPASVPAHDTFSTYVDLTRQGFEIARVGVKADVLIVVLVLSIMVPFGMLLWFMAFSKSAVFSPVWDWVVLASLAAISLTAAVRIARRLSLSQLRGFGRLFDLLGA